MFTSHNSLPVYTAHSLPEQAALRAFFEENGLEYAVSLRDDHAPEGFYPAISPALLLTQSISYLFLVHKKEVPRAMELLQRWHWADDTDEAPCQAAVPDDPAE